MECKRREKWVIEQNKMKMDKNFGRKLNDCMKIIKDYIGRKYKKKKRKWMDQWRGGSEG